MSLSRRTFLQCTGLASASAMGLTPQAISTAFAATPQRPPNIVFILADDLGWGDLACYGHPHIKTPHLDQLAREGTLFTQCYASSPVCSPTRAALLTGRFPARLGIHAHYATPEMNEKRGMPPFLDPKVPVVPRLFQETGYKTGHFGKWHLGGGVDGDPTAPEPVAYGIDDFRVFSGNGPTWEDEINFPAKSSELIVDESIRFIEANQQGPFYLETWLKDAHAFLSPTRDQRRPYDEFAGALQTYYAAVTNMDAHVGRLLARLRELGLAENTVVIFSSDNGPEDIAVKNASHSGVGSPGPFRGRKRSLYEGGIRVPLIVRWPGHTPAGVVDNTTAFSSVDYLPTLCSIAGIEPAEPEKLDGEDLSAAFQGRPVKRDRVMYWEFRSEVAGHVWNHSPMLALREGDFKLLTNPDMSRVELYHIVNDPREQNDLARQSRRVVKRLQHRALDLYEQMPKSNISRNTGRDDYPWPGGGASTPAASAGAVEE